MTLKTRLAVAFIAACLLTVGLLMVLSKTSRRQAARAGRPVQGGTRLLARPGRPGQGVRRHVVRIQVFDSRPEWTVPGRVADGLLGASQVWPRFDGDGAGAGCSPLLDESGRDWSPWICR